jgi:hypothetical protein
MVDGRLSTFDRESRKSNRSSQKRGIISHESETADIFTRLRVESENLSATSSQLSVGSLAR